MPIILFTQIYIIGIVFALLIYDVYLYEKYKNQIFYGFDRKDIWKLLIILLSWIALCYMIFRLKKYKFIYGENYENNKKSCKGFLESI